MSKGKIALVTGGNRGIGQEIARQLATKGFRVILTARDPKAGAKAASSIKGDIGFLVLDVADDESITQAAESFGTESDRLDVLVNNGCDLSRRRVRHPHGYAGTTNGDLSDQYLWRHQSSTGFSPFS